MFLKCNAPFCYFLLASIGRLSDDPRSDESPGLNTTFDEDSLIRDETPVNSLENDENRLRDENFPRHNRPNGNGQNENRPNENGQNEHLLNENFIVKPSAHVFVGKKSPLQEINCLDENNRAKSVDNHGHAGHLGQFGLSGHPPGQSGHSGHPVDHGDFSQPASSYRQNNPASAYPQTPMQKVIPSNLSSSRSTYHQQLMPQQQQQQQQQLHPGLKTPMNSMRPPQMPLFTPAQPMFPGLQHQQPYSRKQKFVQINGISYQLIRQIGSGGSCKVHQGKDN